MKKIQYVGETPIRCGWHGGGRVEPKEFVHVTETQAEELLKRREWIDASGAAAEKGE